MIAVIVTIADLHVKTVPKNSSISMELTIIYHENLIFKASVVLPLMQLY